MGPERGYFFKEMKLFLQDGSSYEGESFGTPLSGPARGGQGGEVVFNTGMVGYVESLTDPSYAGQILVCTYPLIGNYGVPDKKFFESEKVQIAGLVVSEYSMEYSHQSAKQSLAQWLKDSGVPAITGVDTRAITKRLREQGVMLGALGSKAPKIIYDPNAENLVASVSVKKKIQYGSGPVKVILIDCGMKNNQLRSLTRDELTIVRVPWDYDFTQEPYDAVFVSNGPGDPGACVPTIEHLKKAMEASKPILGVCLGNQLLALAAGAKTYKLK